jgi:hypothetical protein
MMNFDDSRHQQHAASATIAASLIRHVYESKVDAEKAKRHHQVPAHSSNNKYVYLCQST